ncbi:hypothetical protein AC249_AIPGENE11012 [Exaiptasia diaphana]|nr:hypothetical protein AC249_AIPGENE11012 [Exaiptasia diaphana]
MKAHIKRWVNEKHNVLTAEDMKEALESHGDIKGCRVAVVEVNTAQETNSDNKIAAKVEGRVGESVRQRSDIYACQESGCILTFKTQAEADDHMDTGKHRLEADQESMYDRIRKKWAGVVTGVTFAPDVPSTSGLAQSEDNEIVAETQREPGWAPKTTKATSRMSENVKSFLTKLYEDGSRTGMKSGKADEDPSK